MKLSFAFFTHIYKGPLDNVHVRLQWCHSYGDYIDTITLNASKYKCLQCLCIWLPILFQYCSVMRRLSVLFLICGSCVGSSGNDKSLLEKISPVANILESSLVEMFRPARHQGQNWNDVKTCCATGVCVCPYQVPIPVPMPLPMPIIQTPLVVPARTVFEPVVHDHPPLHEIQKIIKKHKKSRRRPDYSSSSSSDNYSSDDSTSSDTSDESRINYYDDFISVTG